MPFNILVPFGFGLLVFLLGLSRMRTGLEKLARDRLHDILLQFTKSPLRSFFTGTVTTAFLQSSSAVTVLTIGFVNAGMLSFSQSLGIILGTNVGTTITTQILALNIEDLAIPLMVLGGGLYLLPHPVLKNFGSVFLGFGAIFWGIEWMQSIAFLLKEQGWISWLLHHGGNPIVSGLLAGTAITALIHSSSACIAMTMGFFAAGAVPLPFAIAAVFGSNIGTCITALMASIRTIPAARQAAFSHLVLNVAGVIVFTPLIPAISAVTPYLSNDPATQIAHIQTLFNLICSIAVLPFCDQFARGITWLIPQKSAPIR
ncbi:Na/Pi cotransporter family protein [Thermoactinomyces mirandus]|uniref:Na/Pi cotransporter family protein n=1 Tax=Thermoactinomyces mirandus TaxID=2756294 RepID=A0A7W1XPD4_9BACL|nr:Na/Pi symporter [Thermoactinomyces mirandus]MBA4600764.1 Na/Pi cotransporter family protein [Thermoactinomyces mirandus]